MPAAAPSAPAVALPAMGALAMAPGESFRFKHPLGALGGKAAEADALLKSMARDGIAPDQWTYGPLLEACRRAGNRQRAARYGERGFKELTPPPSFCVTSRGRSRGAGGLAALAKRCGVDPATLPPPRPAGERRRGK